MTGFSGRRLLSDISDKIAGQIAGEVKKTVAAEAKAREERVRTEGEIVQMATAQISDLAAGAPAVRIAQLAANVAPIQGLAEIVAKYTAITWNTHPDYGTRVQANRAEGHASQRYTHA